MNAKQDALYWREWGKLTRRCKKDGLEVPDRKELHAKALADCKQGVEKTPCAKCAARLASPEEVSHLEFDNHWFDLALAEFRAWSQPGNLRGQMKLEEMPETRMLWKLDNVLVPKLVVLLDGLPECRAKARGVAHNYVGAISQKKYGERDFRRLPASDLQNLLRDVTRAVGRMAEKKGLSSAEVAQRAGLAAQAAADNQPEGEPF